MAFSAPAETSPLRLLILTPAACKAPGPIAPLLTALTGSAPSAEQISTGFAGYTTHAPLQIRTKYYNASIGIWCDEVGEEWKATMADTAEEAQEVRSALGGIVFVLDAKDIGNKNDISKAMDGLEQVEEIRAMCEDEGDGREVVGVAVLVGDGAEARMDEVEEELREGRGMFGWDVVALEDGSQPAEEGNPRNHDGEKTGIDRVKEILEAVPWTTSADDEEADFSDSDNDADWTTSEQKELDREMIGLKMDLHKGEVRGGAEEEAFGKDEWPELQGGSEDVKVEQLQGLMERLIATREAASVLSGAEKQKFAKREVERIMKEMR